MVIVAVLKLRDSFIEMQIFMVMETRSTYFLVLFCGLGLFNFCLAQNPLFELLAPEKTGLLFKNQIIENEKINILTYEYFHNGGGVAIGDINKDGLPDVYLTGNLAPNRLFLNKGNFIFEDITNSSGTSGSKGWNTGVTMVDINNDGWLDIYVCVSGNLPDPYRANQLFVNNQNGTFTERAAEFGIADTGYATQAAFFDFDTDGDLDLFILNHNIFPINNFNPKEARSQHDPNVGDKLYRNDNGFFTDVSLSAGIHTNPLGYGLGVSIGDLNNDQLPDIYVANDFIEHDYCYLNNGDGTFSDIIKTGFPQISQFSMGTDVADFNNDGWMDIISVDMVAEENYRQKTTMRPMDRTVFYYAIEDGFHYQYMHNALQLNRGNGHFSNISKLAGVSNTDWSWAPLFLDLDLDGHKDLVITNGYKKDISNKDYVAFEKQKIKEFQSNKLTNAELFRALLEAAPVTKIQNYVFRNNGDYTFSKMNAQWGFEQKAFSNGAAYGDLDNDGDLDLVINNIDENAFLFRNNAVEQERGNFLKIGLSGSDSNPFGIGARVALHLEDKIQYFEVHLTRGFQSSVDPNITVGLGKAKKIDKVVVTWPDGKITEVKDLAANQFVKISYETAFLPGSEVISASPWFEDLTGKVDPPAIHIENSFDDFEYEVLLPHKMSNWGPALAVGDVNGDQLPDFYLGGASAFAGQLFLQNETGQFEERSIASFEQHAVYEDLDASFFDADVDGDLDLYVVSGGNEFELGSSFYQDRLYLNDGSGNFSFAKDALPEFYTSGSVVRPFDFDADGDLDLFVGGRMQPRQYPKPASSEILINENGTFKRGTESIAPELADLGMVTDAIWCDFDQDQDVDLIIAGEWMPITFFENKNGQFLKVSKNSLTNEVGWWFSIDAADFDQDGDLDFIGGNLGTNYKYKTTPDAPFQVFLNDFDENGHLDIVLGYFEAGALYPVRGRQCSSEQMPFIKEKFPTYDLFGQANLYEIYGESSLEESLNYKATNFQSIFIENLGKGNFKWHPLPVEAQFAAINDCIIRDFNEDGALDILIAGNLFASEVETPRNDAGVGYVLLGNGRGDFEALPPYTTGLYLPFDVRKMVPFGDAIFIGCNNDQVRIIRK